MWGENDRVGGTWEHRVGVEVEERNTGHEAWRGRRVCPVEIPVTEVRTKGEYIGQG